MQVKITYLKLNRELLKVWNLGKKYYRG